MVAVGTPAVCVLLLLAVAGSVVSGFTPVTYPATVSSECDQYDPLQDQQLKRLLARLWIAFFPISDLVRRFSIAPHQLPQAITR